MGNFENHANFQRTVFDDFAEDEESENQSGVSVHWSDKTIFLVRKEILSRKHRNIFFRFHFFYLIKKKIG